MKKKTYPQSPVPQATQGMVENQTDADMDVREKKLSMGMRIGAFGAGCGFLILSAVDAMYDPFPGPETFFAGTGVTLIIVGVTGEKPKKEK